MNVLVTGGKGFIGKHLCEKLKCKHKVEIIDFTDVEPCWDIKNSAWVGRLIDSFMPDVVVHLAAQPQLRHSINFLIGDATNNIMGSLYLLEQCKNHGVKKFIYASTGGARYGNASGIVKESCQPKPVSPYGISKHTVEHYLEYYKLEYDIDYSVLCFGNVYGPGDHINNGRIITKAIDCTLKGKTLSIFGNGENQRDYLYIGDLVEFISDNFDNDKIYNQIINIGTGKIYSVIDVIGEIKKISGKSIRIKFEDSIKSEPKNIGLNVDKVFNLTGWKANTLLGDGIKKTFNWFKEQYDKSFDNLF